MFRSSVFCGRQTQFCTISLDTHPIVNSSQNINGMEKLQLNIIEEFNTPPLERLNLLQNFGFLWVFPRQIAEIISGYCFCFDNHFTNTMFLLIRSITKLSAREFFSLFIRQTWPTMNVKRSIGFLLVIPFHSSFGTKLILFLVK